MFESVWMAGIYAQITEMSNASRADPLVPDRPGREWIRPSAHDVQFDRGVPDGHCEIADVYADGNRDVQ
jgi:hypothetical protein